MGYPVVVRCLSLFLCAVLLSCGPKQSSKRAYGKMTVADLVREKGQPSKEESVPVADTKILKYPNEESFQVKGEIVVNSFRQPSQEESVLLYWKNAFKDCETELRTLKAASHEAAEMELICKTSGLSVIYTEGSDIISRVVEYAPE